MLSVQILYCDESVVEVDCDVDGSRFDVFPSPQSVPSIGLRGPLYREGIV